MEAVDYTSAILWYASWPVAIWISYKFIRLNIEHLEENLEDKESHSDNSK
jgi:hypothetical protein